MATLDENVADLPTATPVENVAEPESEPELKSESAAAEEEEEKDVRAPEPAVEAETKTAVPTAPTARSVTPTVKPTMEDDAWIKEERAASATATADAGALRRRSSPKKKKAAQAAAKVGASVSKRGQKLEQLLSKVTVLKPVVEFVHKHVVKQQLYLQAYIAIVLLCFGSYFQRSLKCYEVVVLLSAAGMFGSLGALKSQLGEVAQRAQDGAAYVHTLQSLRVIFTNHAAALFVLATCLLGVLTSHIAGSVIIGLSIGQRVDSLVTEFDLRKYLDTLNEKVNSVDIQFKLVFVGLAILLSLIAPVSATAVCAVLMSSKKLAQLKLEHDKKSSNGSSDANLDMISVRFWTAVLLGGGLVANFIVLDFSLPYMIISFPMVIVENFLYFVLA